MMRVCFASLAAVLGSCTSQPAKVTDDAAAKMPAAVMSLVNTTWEFNGDGTPMVLTVYPSGAYVEEKGDGTHLDHGTYSQTGGKDCFTSAMGDQGVNCWTAIPDTPIGGTASATSDRGQKAVFTRVAYRPLKTPA